MRQRLEEMDVYRRAEAFTAAIAAILDRPQARRYRDLHEQLGAANDSIMANMEEGYEQSTDRGFARYLFTSKGSLAEVLGWLRRARRRGIITASELKEHYDTGEEIGKMLGGFIKYLDASDFQDRGRFKSRESSDP
jgi:four helix bundle protein